MEVFLSASVPVKREDKSPKYAENVPPDVAFEISEAVNALTVALLGHQGRLVFGGHPSITPLVTQVVMDYFADETESMPNTAPLVVYQSTYFRRQYIEEARWLRTLNITEFHETPILVGIEVIDDPTDEVLAKHDKGRSDTVERALMKDLVRSNSLKLMRDEMLARPSLYAMVAIGGMNGVEEEAAQLRANHPDAPIYLIVSTGGATRFLAKENTLGAIPVDKEFLEANLPLGTEIPPMDLTANADGTSALPLTPYGLVMGTVVKHLVKHLKS